MTKEEIIEEANLRFPKDVRFVWHHHHNLTATNNAYGFIQGAAWAQDQIYNKLKEELDSHINIKTDE